MNTQKFFQALDAARAELSTYSDTRDRDRIISAENALHEAEQEVTEVFADFEVLSKTGHPLRFWDDGFGPLWVYSETLGALGVVRAKSWEDAFSACQDEIMDGATFAEMVESCDLSAEDIAEIESGGDLPDGYQFRSSGEPSNGKLHGELCCEDINGCSLERLTPELAAALELTVNVRFEVK